MAIKVACILMQKDEALRLQPWLDYYQNLFGAKSLFIIDNGSSIPSVIDALKEAVKRGATVDWSNKETSDFLRKELIITDLVQTLDANDPHDFYLLLDCDEFLACEINGEPYFDKKSILDTLNPYINYKGVLFIGSKYWHNPYMPNMYYNRTEWSRKCFFTRGTLKSLTGGFHDGESNFSEEKISVPIVYFEFHYLPYKAHLQLSKSKLIPFMGDLSRQSLTIYVKKGRESAHCAVDLLKTEYEYASIFFDSDGLVRLPGLLEEFDRQGISYKQMFAPSKRMGFRGYLLTLKIQHLWLHTTYFIEAGWTALAAIHRRLKKRLFRLVSTYRP
jgi:hypothetical protein